MKAITFLLLCVTSSFASPATYTIASIDVTPPFLLEVPPVFPTLHTVVRMSLENVNNSTDILPHTTLSVEGASHFGQAALAVYIMISYSELGVPFVIGNYFADISAQTAVVGGVFDIAQLSPTASSPALSNTREYPLFSRLTSSSEGQASVVREIALYYGQTLGYVGWDKIAVISTSDVYGVDLAQSFIKNVGNDITVVSYQQYIFLGELDGTLGDRNVELREIRNSGARIIAAFIVGDYENLIVEANEMGLVGENYVWFVGDSITGTMMYARNETAVGLSRGLLGTFQYIPTDTEEYLQFLNYWYSVDPAEYFGAGGLMSPFYFLTYDMVQVAAKTVQVMDERGLLDSGDRIAGSEWANVIRTVAYNGVSGPISFDDAGDRIGSFSASYFVPETREWILAVQYDPATNEYTVHNDIIWFSNTTDVPDLDIREPFHYWSCHDGERKYDESGKSVTLQTPDHSDVDDIDSTYHCDHFIDCENFSDESRDCTSNYLALFIVFGVVTGVLIFICVLLLVFVIIFGMILKYRRLRVASPFFLILLLLSVIVGYCSIFAWFGKPHPVACGFQPWLLGLSTLSMITALNTKTFRIWRVFRLKMQKIRITDFELLIIWFLTLLPAVAIVTLWTIISTPTAKMRYLGDADHYVCSTGGFTGEPGGIIFFSILVAYGSIILFIGAVLSIATRKVPSMFNECKLLSISIYNLAFLSVVIIPVFLVVQPYNPFIAWILRTVAILYAFTATLVLQFFSPVVGILIIDKGENVTTFKSLNQSGNNQLRNSASLSANNRPRTNSLSS